MPPTAFEVQPREVVPPLPRWSPAVAASAIVRKFHLLRAFDVFWPAALRGGKLLARGRFREFGRKLFREVPPAPESEPHRSGPPLWLSGHLLTLGGYDHIVFTVLRGLIESGVDVHRDSRFLARPELIPPHLRPAGGSRRGTDPRLVVAPPHLLHRFRPDSQTAILTMWETDTLPPGAVKWLNRCGLVIVPSRWGAESFRANGVRVPLEVVPLGHDPELFSPRPASGAEVVFGTAGALDQGGLRKNVQRVIDRFREAFPAARGVRLRVKITATSPPVNTHNDPRIDVVQRSLPPAELAAWYRSLSVFVNGSFGEGFGLHLLEAMACGRPLISTTFGGVSAFFDAGSGWVIPHRLIVARNAIYSGLWADPDDAALVQALREVHANPEQARRFGERAAVRAAGFTWAATIRTLRAALERHGWLAASVGESPVQSGE